MARSSSSPAASRSARAWLEQHRAPKREREEAAGRVAHVETVGVDGCRRRSLSAWKFDEEAPAAVEDVVVLALAVVDADQIPCAQTSRKKGRSF